MQKSLLKKMMNIQPLIRGDFQTTIIKIVAINIDNGLQVDISLFYMRKNSSVTSYLSPAGKLNGKTLKNQYDPQEITVYTCHDI